MSKNPTSFAAALLLTTCLLPAGPVCAAGTPAAAPAPDTDEARSLELLMASQRMDKRAMLKAALDLSPAQSDRFWPIYYAYQAELIPIYDRKFALITQYADAYPELSESQADHLVRGSLTAKREQIDLLEKYYRRVSAALSKGIAARFVQLESAWNGAFDVRLHAKLPLIPEDLASRARRRR